MTDWRGPRWQQRAKAVVDAARRNPTALCWRCEQPFEPGEAIDAGHTRPGDPTSPIAAEHAKKRPGCKGNRSHGAAEGNRRRRKLYTSREW